METEKEKKIGFSYYHIFMAVLVFLIVRSCLDGFSVQQIGYSDFRQHLERGDVKTAVVRGDTITGQFKHPVNGKVTYSTNIVAPELATQFDKHKITYESLGNSSLFGNFILFILPTLLFIGFWYYILRRGLKGMGGAGAVSYTHLEPTRH